MFDGLWEGGGVYCCGGTEGVGCVEGGAGLAASERERYWEKERAAREAIAGAPRIYGIVRFVTEYGIMRSENKNERTDLH